MDITILMSSEKPIYKQIYDQIVAQILNGNLEAGFRFPAIRKMATELGVSVITIKKAWELLEQNGFIYTVVGRGSFVAEDISRSIDDKRLNLAKERLEKDLKYYHQLGLTIDELQELISDMY